MVIRQTTLLYVNKVPLPPDSLSSSQPLLKASLPITNINIPCLCNNFFHPFKNPEILPACQLISFLTFRINSRGIEGMENIIAEVQELV